MKRKKAIRQARDGVVMVISHPDEGMTWDGLSELFNERHPDLAGLFVIGSDGCDVGYVDKIGRFYKAKV